MPDQTPQNAPYGHDGTEPAPTDPPTLNGPQAGTHDLTTIQFSAALGYGDNVTEPAITLTELVDPILEYMSDAHDHIDCPYTCELCGETLANDWCPTCHGSGCGPGTALGAYEPCPECDGAMKVHMGCAEMSYADLTAKAATVDTSWADGYAAARRFYGDTAPLALDKIRARLDQYTDMYGGRNSIVPGGVISDLYAILDTAQEN